MKKMIVAAAVLFTACTQNPATWSGADRINFRTDTPADTLTVFSFVPEAADITRHTVWVEVNTEGMARDYARPITLEQVLSPEGSDAMAGVHFVAFDNPEVSAQYVVPAGACSAKIPIVLLRDRSLTSRARNLRVELAADSNFGLSIDGEKLHRDIKFADMLMIPYVWSVAPQVRSYFGVYGIEKHRFMIEATGMQFDDAWFNEQFYYAGSTYGWMPNDGSYLGFLRRLLQDKLNERNAREGNVLKEINGTIVNFL